MRHICDQEFAQFIAGRKKVSRKKQLKDLDGRLNTFAQAGANPRMKRTPRVWSSMLTDEVRFNSILIRF